MAHQHRLEKEKYRQWVKAGLGLGYLKEGLEPFCDDVAKEQHKHILDNIKQTKNLPTVTCGHCALRTLKPDHVKTGNKQCPLGQANCNCCYTSGKFVCPNNVCGAIYDSIITNHASTPPAPNWKNTQTQQWTGDPWSIAKCFINIPGYDQKASAADTDCTGLLHVIINNKYFHNHIQCNVAGANVFSKVRHYRNEIFHSSTMELKVAKANTYIDDMIAVLKDGKELVNRKDAQDAVKKLEELKKNDFIITTKSERDVVHDAVQSISDTIEEYENKLQEKLENVPTIKGVENKLREELENVPTKEDVENTIREKLEKVPTKEDVENKLREKLENVSTKVDVENKLREKLETIPTAKYVEGLETRVTILELDITTLKKEMKDLKTARSFQRDQYDYIRSKLEYQTNLIRLYRQSMLQVSAIPLKPERKHCNFSNVYVRPQLTHETKDENRKGKPKETEIQSVSDIFIKAGNRLKSIYVLGDAGSGKSSFCKSLVNFWCTAHSGEPSIDDDFDGIKEMKKFEFLFYIALRHFNDVVSIPEMLEKQYKSKILNEILIKESKNIIIVLDGLDEWSSKTVTSNQFQTEGLPQRDISEDYTVITTSRPWKIETLGITDKEIEQKLKLKGFNRSSVTTMIDQTVLVLNESFAENKSPSACKDKLNNEAIASMIKVPIMLLQLICLWFDDKLQVSSRCAVYSAMLELFFSWNDKKKKEEEEECLFRKMRELSKDFPNTELPKYLMNSKFCKLYKYPIYELSRLAYETLFRNEKEASLTFESSVLEELKISDEVKTSCLKLGILSEDRCPSLYASTSDSSSLSFVHKSVQEYLAAVYIAIKLKNAHNALYADTENANLSGRCAQIMKTLFCQCATNTDNYSTDLSDHYAQLIKEFFSNCTTSDEILEQTNIFVLLCGLEPRIATSLSKYIYDIVTRDTRVIQYRRTIYKGLDEYRNENLISNIQECILNCTEEVQACHTSTEEVQACHTNILSSFYVGDIITERRSVRDHFCTCIGKQYISPDSVRSFRVHANQMEEYLVKTVLRYLPKCQQLELIYIDVSGGRCRIDDEDIKSISGGIKNNTSTLKSLFIDFEKTDSLKPLYKTIVCLLPNMSHLVALYIAGYVMPHEDVTSLCAFLSGRSQLEQISITLSEPGIDSVSSIDSVFDECGKQHEVDLSKHPQLQYLGYDKSFTVTGVNTSNLEIYNCGSLNSTNFVKVFDNLSTADKLTKLVIRCEKNLSHNIVTEKLITLLPLLHQLGVLILLQFTFTDNIMKCPLEMKGMKSIVLTKVIMSLTTWRQFVDSLPLLPLPVEVRAQFMRITRDGKESNPDIDSDEEAFYTGIDSDEEECNPDLNLLRGEEAAAWRYVRDQEALFNVEFELYCANSIDFSTKKYKSLLL